MDMVVYIRGPAEGLDVLAERLDASGFKCTRALDQVGRGELPDAAEGTLGMTGELAAITVVLMTFLATHRKTWRLRSRNGIDILNQTCQQLESLLVRSRLVLERISPDETTTFKRSSP